MEVIFELVEIFICFLEAYLMFDFFMAFFPLRKVFQKKYVGVAAVVMTAVCIRLVNLLDNSTVNIISMQIIYLSLLFGLFIGSFLRKIFCYLVGTAIMIGSEFLWIVIMSLPSDFSMGQVQNNLLFTIVSMLCIRLITFILFNITKRVPKDSSEEIDWKNFMIYSVVPVSTLGIMICMAYLGVDFDYNKNIQIGLSVFILSAIIGDILIFQIFNRYLKNIKKLNYQQLIITKWTLEEKRYEQIEAVNQEHASFLHDIKHYMKVIGEVAAQSKNKEILEIISELQIKVSDMGTEVYCHNRLLNTILNEKKKESLNRQIDMKITIEPEFKMDQIENMDLIVIMGNLLENAIEAAEKCKNGFIKIYLYVQNETSFSVIKIVNSYVGSISVERNIFLTNKEDKAKHGFEIQNIKAAIEKYNGYFQSSYTDEVFTTVVLLPNCDTSIRYKK